MLTEDDLKAAIAEDILTEDQAARLMAFTRERQGGQADYVSRDEPFRLFRGFRDFFLAIGLVILAVGLVGGVTTFYDGTFPTTGRSLEDTFFRLILPVSGLAAIAWLMGEWITRKLRLPLSSIVIVTCFCLACAWLGAALAGMSRSGATEALTWDTAQSASALSALAAAVLFYLRFRLPFVLLPLAASAVGFAVALLGAWNPDWLSDNLRYVTAISGLAVFIVAMRYDMADPNRITRRSECAFWLHLLAAPLIVHSIVGGLDSQTTASAGVVIAVIVGLAFVALLVDRRALLVSALIYLATAISTTISDMTLLAENRFVTTALILGVIVVGLGLGWTPARNALIRLFPEFSVIRRSLPPVSQGSA